MRFPTILRYFGRLMLKKSIYLLFLLGILTTVGCTKDHVVEPGTISLKGGDEDDTVDDGGLISDDEDDEGDGERDRSD